MARLMDAVIHEMKMNVTENFIYLSQIDSKDIFVYSHDAYSAESDHLFRCIVTTQSGTL